MNAKILYCVGLACLMSVPACHSPTQGTQQLQEPLAPCITVPYKKWQECLCHPNVQPVIDIMGPQLTENSRREIEKCLSGNVAVNASIQGKQYADIQAKLTGCLSTRIQLDESINKTITSIAIALQSNPPKEKYIDRWNDCIYSGKPPLPPGTSP